MKIHREVLIESAEQAEALPEGSIAMQEKYLSDTPRHASGFTTPDRAS